MELKQGTKQSGMGAIPKDWQWMPLRRTCRAIYRGASPRPIGDARWFDDASSIGWVRISDVTQSNRYLRSTSQRLSKAGVSRSRLLSPGSLIMSICATVGRPIELAIDACIHDGFVVFERPAINQSFLYHVLCDLEPQWSKQGQTGSQMNLNTSLIKLTSIAAPSAEPEQQAIAAALSDVDGLIASLDRLIAKKGAIKQAAMQQLLTGEIRLPGFKSEWQRVKLGELGTFSRGSGIRKDQIVADGVPCVRYGELYTVHRDVVRSVSSFIDRSTAATSTRLRQGDLLFAGSGETSEEIGKCAAWVGEEEGYAGGDIVIFSPVGQNSVFLGYLMNHPSVAEQKARLGQGDAVVHINPKHLSTLSFRRPELDEQAAIAQVLDDIDADIAAIEARRMKASMLKQGMMQALLTGRVRLV